MIERKNKHVKKLHLQIVQTLNTHSTLHFTKQTDTTLKDNFHNEFMQF